MRAHSLPELMFGIQLLLVIVVCLFIMFRFGSRSFQLAVTRQGIEGEARRVAALIENDLLNSHYQSINIIRRTFNVDIDNDGEKELAVARYGVCMVGLRGWDEPGNFDFVTGMPIWNEHIVYYATDEEEGRLIRQIIRPPGGAKVSQYRLLTFSSANNMNLNPATNRNQQSYITLSTHVLDFNAATENSNQAVRVALKLRGKNVRRATSDKRVDETFQMERRITPENTFPRL
jgi:hypothetical protein